MFSSITSGNKSIAINTIVVYVRLFIVTIFGLITSRLVLKLLGVSDYGLYNVVGGIIALFSVVSGSLSTTTIRFLNIEMGKENGNPNKLFNICNVIHIIFAIILLVVAESVGIWYINNFLNIAPGKELDAMFTFQVSTIVACLGIINIPYISTFVAKEKFVQIAIIDIANSIIKLFSVLCLFFFDGNALKAYALLMSLSTIFSFILYHYLSYRQWVNIVKWNFVPFKSDYLKVLVYNNYNILSTISLVARSQGSNILINFFFGTIVNGAYAIARTIQGFVESFMANFDTAAAPRIIQKVGAGESKTSENIVIKICRYCILMIILVFFPLMAETELILNLWLGQVPEYSVRFCRLLLVVVLVASTAGGILQYINASEQIKWFKIQSCFWSLIVLPIGFILFQYGFEAWWIFVLFIISDILNRVCQLFLMKRLLDFNVVKLVSQAYARPLFVICIMVVYLFVYDCINLDKLPLKVLGTIITFVVTLICVWFIGLVKQERIHLQKFCIKK